MKNGKVNNWPFINDCFITPIILGLFGSFIIILAG